MRKTNRFVSSVFMGGVLLTPVIAGATPDETTSPPPQASPPPQLSSPSHELPAPRESAPLEWRWQRFRVWEYPVTAVALAGAFYLRFKGPQQHSDWTGGVLIDDWVEDRVAIQSISRRRTAVNVTDVFFYGSMAYRFVDSVLLPTIVWRSPGVAFQMSLIDLESFGFVAITLWGQQALFGRERPYAKRCSDPAFAAAEGGCSPDSTEHGRSFYAGHPTVVLTAAGLTCTHHAHLPLYGGGIGDALACGVMIGAAVVTGVGRVITQEHHLSDLLVGYGIGVIAGWVLPEVLHYGHPKPAPSEATRVGENSKVEAPAVRVTLVPAIGPNNLGVDLHGAF